MIAMDTSDEVPNDSAFGAPIDSLERLLSMTADEVDELPYGFIILDAQGTILLYNRYEAALARAPQEHVIGRSFFHDIAPCTRVEAFFGRFREIVSAAPGTSRRFAFRFHFLHGAQDVLVQLTRAPGVTGEDEAGGGARVFLTVVRRRTALAAGPRPPQLALDTRSGRLTGPLGPTFPLGAHGLHLALRSLGEAAAREIGRDVGREIAAAVRGSLLRDLGLESSVASPQLIAGALDDTFSATGFGRLALDFTEYAALDLIGAVVRPPIDLPSLPLAAIYEGLLGVAIGTLLDRPLMARCLDRLDLTPTPWLFTVGPAPIA